MTSDDLGAEDSDSNGCKPVFDFDSGNPNIFIEKISPSGWESIKEWVFSLEKLAFPEPLQQRPDDVERIFKSARSICLVARDKRGNVVGVLYGGPSQEYLECDGVTGDENTYYLASIAVVPEMQNRGIGTLMREVLVTCAKEAGFRFIEEHSMSSEALARNWGAEIYENYADWSESGKKFTRTKMQLDKIMTAYELSDLGFREAWKITPKYRRDVAALMMEIMARDRNAAFEFCCNAHSYLRKLRGMGEEYILPVLNNWLLFSELFSPSTHIPVPIPVHEPTNNPIVCTSATGQITSK